jgi:hypothetical protein
VARFQFDALKWGRVSVAVLFVVGALNLAASAVGLAGADAQETTRAVDAVWLVAGALLCLEQIARRSALRKRDPRGSVLGALVAPFARPLIDGGGPRG